MALNSCKIKTLFHWILVVPLLWIVSGCGSKSAKLPTYMRPESLYLCEEPYSRLYVEVDSVEGVEVPEKTIDDLKEFLSSYCSKPDGIEIVRGRPIPISEIKDLPIGPASILCIDGPPTDDKPQPSYLHIFFYDTDIVFRKAMRNTHATTDNCPCAIFFNVDYAPRWAAFITRHEAGHTLGLCKNAEHGDGVHCTNNGCLMNFMPDLLSQLGSLVVRPPVGHLCDDCRNDLQALKSEKADPDISFNGPFLMRRQEGYSVASLPYCDFLVWPSIVGTFDWQEGLRKIKDYIKSDDFKKNFGTRKRFGWMFGIVSPDSEQTSSQSMVETLGVLTNAADDPNPAVRSYAIKRLEQFRQEQSK